MVKLLLDTDVIIDFLKGNKDAQSFLVKNQKNSLYISAMSVAELFAGVRNEKEIVALTSFLKSFDIINIDNEIGKKGGLYRKQYGKSHGVGIADAIIAACAEEIEAKVVTLNKKHYPMFASVIVPYIKL